ncbi:DUF4253 domain-containing protein, partial [Pseudonocardia pini]|uniref:DUF4253 domain-containing protein n=1 Tax=Pseudonocardia pini TaxID=2758030 RepID=UPI0015F070E9
VPSASLILDDPNRLATVLRSWEERFGAVVTELAADRLTLTVATPPWTMPEAERVAAEHVAVCPDLAARSLRGYAARLCGARVWRLRWG